MPSKQCFKCGESKQLSAFYKHKKMSDGHLNKCKDCTKKDSLNNRARNIDSVREYDRLRGNRQTKEYATKRKKLKNAYIAHNAVSNAIRDGRLSKKPCQECGATRHIHAHHSDYLKPLDVMWLCPVHHFEWHSKNGPGLNP